MLNVRELSIYYMRPKQSPLHVLDRVSFTVGCGEVVSILGPSGCGKTTLLRCIAGLLKPSSGDVKFETSVDSQSQVSLTFQRPVLLEWLTVGENLRLPHRFAGRNCQPAAIENSLKAFKLESTIKEYFPAKISIGQAQRVCLARAVSENASLLLLDEPFSALDEITRRDVCIDLSKSLAGRSAIFVTHAIHDAVFLAQRVIVLSGDPMSGRATRVVGDNKVDLPIPRSASLWLSEELAPYLSNCLDQLAEK